MKNRPRFLITCDGAAGKPHRPAVVALYARDDDGTWLPIHSAFRTDGKSLVLPESGYRSAAGQFDWPCPNRRCAYRFRADVARVSPILDRRLASGESEASLRSIEGDLRL